MGGDQGDFHLAGEFGGDEGEFVVVGESGAGDFHIKPPRELPGVLLYQTLGAVALIAQQGKSDVAMPRAPERAMMSAVDSEVSHSARIFPLFSA